MSVVADLIISYESSIMGAKYISAVALSCLVYDHLLNFDNEFTGIWCNFWRKPMLRSWFLLGRYCTIIGVGCHAISSGVLNTDMTVQNCRALIIMSVIFTGLSMVGTEGIVMYRLRSLWFFNRLIARAITTMVVVVLITTVVSISIEAVKYEDHFMPIPGLAGCFPRSLPSGPGPYTLLTHCAFGQDSRLSTVCLVLALGAITNARIFHGIALETEKYADEYDGAILPKATS